MKLIYKDNRYPCILKSEMEKNMWYSMEPVKLTVTIPLVEYLTNQEIKFKHLQYPDHYHFKEKDISKIKSSYKLLQSNNKIIFEFFLIIAFDLHIF